MPCTDTPKTNDEIAEEGKKIFICKFEVFGKVVGTCFCEYVQARAGQLGVHGFVLESSFRTILGYIEGKKDALKEMKLWLEYKGSPLSRIDRAKFSDMTEIEKFSVPGFEIRSQL